MPRNVSNVRMSSNTIDVDTERNFSRRQGTISGSLARFLRRLETTSKENLTIVLQSSFIQGVLKQESDCPSTLGQLLESKLLDTTWIAWHIKIMFEWGVIHDKRKQSDFYQSRVWIDRISRVLAFKLPLIHRLLRFAITIARFFTSVPHKRCKTVANHGSRG